MKKKLLPALIVTGLIILVVIIMGITALINKYTPTKKTEDLKEYFNISSDDEAALIVDNELSDYKAKIIDKKIYVDYKFVHDSLNSRFYWDANENVLLYTTASDIISAAADSNSYSVTKQTNDQINHVIGNLIYIFCISFFHLSLQMQPACHTALMLPDGGLQ